MRTDDLMMRLLGRRSTNLVFAQLEDDVNIVGILEKGVELDNVLVIKRLVDIDFILELPGKEREDVESRQQKAERWKTREKKKKKTFCLALDFCRLIFETTFTANSWLVSTALASKHLANPPWKRKERKRNEKRKENRKKSRYGKEKKKRPSRQ